MLPLNPSILVNASNASPVSDLIVPVKKFNSRPYSDILFNFEAKVDGVVRLLKLS